MGRRKRKRRENFEIWDKGKCREAEEGQTEKKRYADEKSVKRRGKRKRESVWTKVARKKIDERRKKKERKEAGKGKI